MTGLTPALKILRLRTAASPVLCPRVFAGMSPYPAPTRLGQVRIVLPINSIPRPSHFQMRLLTKTPLALCKKSENTDKQYIKIFYRS